MVKLQKKILGANEVGYGFIDIGKYSDFGYVESPTGSVLNVFEFTKDKAGFEKLDIKLNSFVEKEGLKSLKIGLESTGTYGDVLIEHLEKSGIELVQINPKHLKRIKEVWDNSPGKSDKKDPKVGTMLVKGGKHQSILKPKGKAAELRVLTSHREQLKTQESRLLNQIESHVARVFPELMVVMKGLKTKTVGFLLGHYILPEDITGLGIKKLSKMLQEKSSYQLGAERATELYKAAVESVGIQEGKTSIRLAIKALSDQLSLVRTQIKEAEKQINIELRGHEEGLFLKSIPQIGILTAAEIIGQTGGLKNFKNASQVEKLAGLNLYSLSSGTKQGVYRISKRGRGMLRKVLYLAALRTVKKGGIYRSHYERHLSNGMKKPQAIIAVSKKLLRTMFALTKNEQKFDVEKVV